MGALVCQWLTGKAGLAGVKVGDTRAVDMRGDTSEALLMLPGHE